MFINKSLFFYGLAIWFGATLTLRFYGQFLLRPDHLPSIIILFGLSLPVMVLLVRRLCGLRRLPPDQWVVGAASLALPSLILDSFSSAFFSTLYPNMAANRAGLFGGWILWCCCGAMLGGMIRLGK